MQTVSAGFTSAASAPVNDVSHGLLVSWLKTYNDTANFFTIGSSAIGGTDFIKGAGSDPTFFDKYDYVDETEYINSMGVSRDLGVLPYGLFMAQADVELDNTSKRFLPGFDATIGDYIKPKRPIKINAGFDGETVTQFVGYGDDPSQTLVGRNTKIHAYDAIDYLDNIVIRGHALYVSQYWHDILEDLLVNEAGFSASQFEIEDSLQRQIGFLNPNGLSIGAIIRKACEAEQGIFFADETGKLKYWNRLHLNLNSTPVATFNYDNLQDIQFKTTPIINHVRVKALPRYVAAEQKIWQNSSAFEINPGQVRRIPIDFSDDYGALPVTTAITPVYIDDRTDVNKSFYATNDNAQGTGDTMEGYITVTDFDLVGDTAFIEFTNSSTSDVIFITQLQIYGTPAKVLTEIDEEYYDQTSIDEYGVNPDNNGVVIEIVNDYIQDESTALALATNLVDEYSDPRQQFSIKPFANPALQFGDPLTLEIADTSESKTVFITGSVLQMSPGALMEQALTVDERILRSYFTIGTSAIGGPDAIPA